MFKNVSSKLKGVSKFIFGLFIILGGLCFIGGIISIVFSLVTMNNYYYSNASGSIATGIILLVYAVFLIICGYISALSTYGFAELLESSNNQQNLLAHLVSIVEQVVYVQDTNPQQDFNQYQNEYPNQTQDQYIPQQQSENFNMPNNQNM